MPTYDLKLVKSPDFTHLHRPMKACAKIHDHFVQWYWRYYRTSDDKRFPKLEQAQAHLEELKRLSQVVDWSNLDGVVFNEVISEVDKGYRKFWFEKHVKELESKRNGQYPVPSKKQRSFKIDPSGFQLLDDNQIRIMGKDYSIADLPEPIKIQGDIEDCLVKRSKSGNVWLTVTTAERSSPRAMQAEPLELPRENSDLTTGSIIKVKLQPHSKNQELHRQFNLYAEVRNHFITLYERYYRRFGKPPEENAVMKLLTRLKKVPRFEHWRTLNRKTINCLVRPISWEYWKFGQGKIKNLPQCEPPNKLTSFRMDGGYKMLNSRCIYIGPFYYGRPTRNGKEYTLAEPVEIEGKIKYCVLERDGTGDIYLQFVT